VRVGEFILVFYGEGRLPAARSGGGGGRDTKSASSA
jgi:hypothetical protein